MNILKIISLTCLVLFLGMTISSCGSKSTKSNGEQTGKEYTSAYICPMHCEGSGSDAPGQCPVCGMDYEKNENATSNGDNHDHGDHDGHDHDDHDGHNH